MCNHNDVDENPMHMESNLKLIPDRLKRFIYQGSRWESSALFAGICNKCNIGVNRHDCHIEGEKYYFSCDEARVINNVARQYDVEGSITTATSVRD